jgi:hypothetical protein
MHNHNFLPQRAVMLPTPEGFTDLEAPDKLRAMKELRTDPETDPYVLQGAAWNVLGDAFYEQELPNRKLLSEARQTLQTIVDRKDLPEDDPNIYLDSRLALIGYDVFRSIVDDEPLSDKSRQTMARHAGRLIYETAGPVDYSLDDLDKRVARKMLETMVIGMVAQRTRPPITTPVTAIPSMHNLRGIDPGTGTSDFSVYLIQEQQAVPTAISKFIDTYMYDPERHRGVLQLAVGPLLMNTSFSIEGINEERALQGSIAESQRWLMNEVARTMALNAAEGVPVSNDYAILMDLAARYVGIRAGDYIPDGLNAPINNRGR